MGVLNVVIGVTAVLLLFLMSMHLTEAGRVLLDEEENSAKNKLFVLMESKKASTPPDGSNQGTNIPNPTNGRAASTINERNFAGHTTMPPPYANLNSKSPALTSDLMESKRGPTPPGGPNPPTNIPSPANPTNGHAASTINERNFAGHTTMPPPYANPNFKSPVLTSNLMESKIKAPVPCGPNPGTNIPRPSCPANPSNGLAASTINERNFAGHTTMLPPYANSNSKSPALTSDLMESKKGPIPSGGPNPPTNIPSPANPTNGHAASTINERNFAGHTTMPPPYANPNFKSPVLTSDLMESKPKGPSPPRGPNPPTNIPRPVPSPANPTNGHAASTINERNFAGYTSMRPPYANPNSKSPVLTNNLMESKKAPVPCAPNPSSNIPRPSCPANPTNGLAASTINERNFAGHTTMPPPYAYPNFKSPVLTGVVMNQK